MKVKLLICFSILALFSASPANAGAGARAVAFGSSSSSISRSSISSFGSVNRSVTPMKSSTPVSRPPQQLRDSSTINSTKNTVHVSHGSAVLAASRYNPYLRRYETDNSAQSYDRDNRSSRDYEEDSSEESTPIVKKLREVNSSKMESALRAIKKIPLEKRIASNQDYVIVKDNYNDAREIWLRNNEEMIDQGQLNDPGDASFYVPPVKEVLVDGEHTQKEIDDANSSRKWLEEQNRKEISNRFFTILFVILAACGSSLVFKIFVLKKQNPKI